MVLDRGIFKALGVGPKRAGTDGGQAANPQRRDNTGSRRRVAPRPTAMNLECQSGDGAYGGAGRERDHIAVGAERQGSSPGGLHTYVIGNVVL
jgi:hypothetical protein